ncbi:MAG: hypothetical protein JWP38_2551 [Herbaspirillum sp.]|nr:hypothetical protein [Herbaspirillum sp.]
MTKKTLPRYFWAACLLVCLLAFGLRLPNLQGYSLWLDESYSAWFSSMSLHDLWSDVPLYEIHPPMYYTLLKGWRAIAGASEAGLRSLSVLASVATVLVLALSGRVLRAGRTGDQVGLLAALFLAVNEGNVNYAQQARPYALETLTATLAILSSLVLLRQLHARAIAPSASPFAVRSLVPAMAALAVTTGATLWLHNTAMLIAFGIWSGLTISLLIFVPRNRMLQVLAIVIPGVAALLIWSPFLPMFLQQNHNMAGMAYWATFRLLDSVQVVRLISGGYLGMSPIILLAPLGLWQLWRIDRVSALHMLIVLVLPLSFMVAYSYFHQPVFVDRLFEWMAPSVMVLAALGVVLGLRRPTWRGAATLVTLAFCLYGTVQFHKRGPYEDWRGWLSRIASEAKQGDLVIFIPNEIDMPLHYYYADKVFPEVLSLPAAFPARGLARRYIGNLGGPGIIPADQALVHAATAGHARVWLVQRGSKLFDPNSIIRAELSSSRKLAEKFGDSNVVIELFD